jgi:hypothetical protein
MSNSYVLLEKIVVPAAGASSVTFANIPQTGYTDLKVVISGRDSSSAGQSWDGYSFTIRPNGLTTNITQRSLFANGSSAASYSDTSMFNVISMNADTANTFSNVEIYIPNYASSNAKSFSIDGVTENNATNSAIRLSAGLWNQTAAITSLQLNAYSTWLANSTFYLYGVAKLGTTPTIAPKATGGDVIDTDGTYWYHIFRSSGTFTPATALTCDYLVVAGGGAGGQGGGGGGAGGYLTSLGGSPLSVTATAYTVTIGAGGTGSSSSANPPAANQTSGTNSVFGAITATGGGRGGSYDVTSGANGGSGGGGTDGGFGTGTSGQGNNGGVGAFVSGGGGGGASAAGGVGNSSTNGGNGGAGQSNSITGTSVTYAGGGGGAAWSTRGSAGTGGAGGGGNGTNTNATAQSGTANTGGGGGGGGFTQGGSPPFGTSGNGGSGIVVVRYLVA